MNIFVWFLGDAVYEGIDFSGTMFVQTANDDDFIGFVFGYNGPRKFYLVSWKQREQNYWRSRNGRDSKATPGLEIKVSGCISKDLATQGGKMHSPSLGILIDN